MITGNHGPLGRRRRDLEVKGSRQSRLPLWHNVPYLGPRKGDYISIFETFTHCPREERLDDDYMEVMGRILESKSNLWPQAAIEI